MINKVKTDAGERWAIVLRDRFPLSDLAKLQNSLIYVMQACSSSDFFGSSGEEFYAVLDLLSEILPTQDQMHEYERYLESKTSKTLTP